MNFALYIVHLFALSLAHFRGWGFAFAAWVRDIENRDCLYTNPNTSEMIAYTKIQMGGASKKGSTINECNMKELYLPRIRKWTLFLIDRWIL